MRRTRSAATETKSTASSQSFYVDNDLFELITKDASQDDRSRSYIVNKILRDYYKKKGKLSKTKVQRQRPTKRFKE